MLSKVVAAAAQSRAHRALRLRILKLALVASVATGGLAGLLLGSPLGPELASPGPISDSHATLAGDCGNCHIASTSAVKGPLHGIVVSHTSFEESTNCTGCHAFGTGALAPHTFAQPGAGYVRASVAPGRPQRVHGSDSGPEYSCATCHHEHRGRDASLTAMPAGRCQSCHAESFTSIADGHPDFGAYPYVKRLSIAFDHAAHIGRYFEERGGGPATCMDCHRNDGEGTMRVASFEQTCASCHSAEVEGHGRADATGLAFLGLPAIDTESLEEAGVDVGMWPASADVSDAPMPPITALLLSANARSAADLESVAGLDWLDLYEASDEQKAALGRIVWDVKALFAELGAGGQHALRERLEHVLGRPLATPMLAALSGGLSPGDLQAAIDTWLPRLEAELRARKHDRAEILESPLPEASEPAEDWVLAGGWYSDDYSFTLRRRPCGHADPFLRGWLELVVEAGGASSQGALGRVFQDLADPDGPGQCTKCHGVEVDPAREVATVHWREPSQDFQRGALVRFDHEPHLTLLDDRGCTMCHGLAESTEGFADAFARLDAREFVSAFTPLTPDTCAECHTPTKSGGDCLTCHQYHEERPRPTRLQALPALAPVNRNAGLTAERDSSSL